MKGNQIMNHSLIVLGRTAVESR